MLSTTPGTEMRAEEPRPPASEDRPARPRPREVPRRADEATTFTQLAWTLLEYRLTVLLVFLLAVGLVAARLFLATPSYDTSVLVQVEGRTKTVPGFTDVSPLFERESAAAAEMRIMASRPLLQGVVEELELDTEARPRTLPVLGDALLRHHTGPELAAVPLDLTRYAWGGERIVVRSVEIAPELLGKPLTLTAREGRRYELAAPGVGVILQGEVGKRAVSAVGPPRASMLVTELVARPGTEFVVVKRRASDVVDQLQASVRITEAGRGAGAGGGTGVVEASLSGPDPARVAAILNAIAAAYVRQNVERTSAEATKTLQFLEQQLPALRANMDRAEVAMNSFRRDNGAVDLTAEGTSMFTRAVDVDRAISTLEVEASELHQRYSDTHPAVAAAEERLKNLRAQRASIDQRLRSLPNLDMERVRLERASRLATELYLNVQNRAQDLRIVNAGWIGSVRVLEPAAPPTTPASPRRAPTVVLGLLLGLAGGIAAALARKGLEQGVEDPDEIEAATGLAVLGAVPRSRAQRTLERRAGRRRPLEPLSRAVPGDVAVEELRNLRTSLQFAMKRAGHNVVTLASPAPRAGKSFVCVNLANLFAAAGRRVVLVDADLRRGQLQRHFGGEREPGLSEVLLGNATLDAAVRATDIPRLSFLATGALPPDPAELSASPRMQEVLADLSRRFDVVLVDTPPVLSVTDSALVGRHAGVNVLVLRAGEQTVREIAFTLRRLSRNGVATSGAILNDVRPSRGRYGRYGGYRLYSTYYARER